ncbi:MAG TPA: SatD family protein [Flavobacteriales bacterium]|nr:SatD family protein [Flavobacteriales bacterium]
MAKRTDHFILMADIIRSSEASVPADLIKRFKAVVDQANKEHPDRSLSPLTITLGDEFQGVMASLQAAVATIVDLEEALLRGKPQFKLRYVIVQGTISTPIVKENAHGMLGTGLTRARQTLTDLKKVRDRRFQFLLNDKRLEAQLSDCFQLFRSIVDRWDEKDKPLASAFLYMGGYREVAIGLRKDPSLMWRRRRSLRMDDYGAARRLLLSLATPARK